MLAKHDDLTIHPPFVVRRPVMLHRWEHVAFVHRPYDPGLVQRLLPPDLEVDTFSGSAWVGIVPFRLTVRLPSWSPPMPWLSTTLESNVRTYVRGPDGGRGIFFFYLDASRLTAVLTARAWYGIPYRWARLRFEGRGSVMRYQSSRREPVPGRLDLRLAVGPRLEPGEFDDLEQFLVCRWKLYSRRRGTVAVTRVEHEPWPLHRADVVSLDDGVVTTAGLPSTSHPPLAHYSPGVEVRFDRRRTVGDTAGGQAARKARTAFCPPKPNEFDRASRIGMRRLVAGV